MALTKIYKVGAVLFVEIAGAAEINLIEYPGITASGTNVILHDFMRFDTTLYTIAVADVRDVNNAAIGTQTKAEVLSYLATEMNK